MKNYVDPNKKTFGNAVNNARKERDMTQSQLAEVVDVSDRWVQRVEQGRILSGRVVLKLIIALEIDREEFREEVNDLVPIPPRGRIHV